MAEVIDELPRPGISKSGGRPCGSKFDAWADGRVWKLTQGTDYGKVVSLRNDASRYGNKKGLYSRVRKIDDTHCAIQFVPRGEA